MFKKIMVPTDLAHADKLDKALQLAGDLSKQYGAEVVLLGVSTSAPSAVAHDPAEYAEKLQAFAARQSEKWGAGFTSKPVASHDPARDLDQTLERQVKETGADLVVMASHVPGFFSHVFSSNAGYLAAHSAVSVFVVR
ncbi:universal stress protein [Afifella sp. IM 167]|uniref:universal stress protein n=1 Tax=Afifella sp. IM 167 TaxID=2033586 RepID=UPI001CCA756B|nr:universal stress protein [Afifella sp. IM 167]MBZ8135378.1 universal stress protein UspA [Afifella sp. IM 167]